MSAVTFISRPTDIVDSVEKSSFSRVLAAVSLRWIEIRARGKGAGSVLQLGEHNQSISFFRGFEDIFWQWR